MLFNCFFPKLPTWNTKPPTLYAVMNSIANFGKEDKTKIKDLYSIAKDTIFNFNYPLSSYVNKEQFEKMILNKFLMRRIGFETVTAFRIALDVKLNEIMPLYNKMFDSLENWDIFNDGEIITKQSTDNRNINNNTTNNNTTNTTSNTNNTLNNNSTTNTTNKNKFSDTPQGYLENVENANYLTNYTVNENTGTDTSNSTGESKNTSSGTNNTIIDSTTTDSNKYNETTARTPADKIKIYTELQENINNIYTLIFKDLDSLFYQIM